MNVATVEQIPEHLERYVLDVVQRLGSLSDDQLFELSERHRRNCGYDFDDPVERFEWAINDLRAVEMNHRDDLLRRAEAEMNGGHLVSVGPGNHVDKFSAMCDPTPPGEACWIGPDRDTVEEAVADGRAHHPGHEPKVADRLTDNE